MGEHDLTLPSVRDCDQLFCVAAHSMPAALPGRPQDDLFIGLGFESGVDEEAYKGEPVSLIAVVDRSGSMSGEPLARVKEGLRSVVRNLREGDRFGIVIYGSDTVVHLPVTDVAGNVADINRAITGIEINGSTYMEAGLKLGYATAFKELETARGKTRLMLFTDENPNVGNTAPEGFMGLATEGSRRGVGLTTIGVGVHFDAQLATKVSSVRGGNLFFVDREGDASALFAKELYNMVGEVAHDVAISIDPADGYKVTGVFGVPANLMTQADDGTITVTIGSAFLSSNGGGIYATLGKASGLEYLPVKDLGGVAPAQVSIAYTDAISGKQEADSVAVMPIADAPPERLLAAQMLVDEYLTLSDALAIHHKGGDKKAVYHALNGLSQRIEQAGLKGFDKEVELVTGLRDRAAYLAGFSGELPKALKPMTAVGEWRVLRTAGVEDLDSGDLVELTRYGEFITQRTKGRNKGEEIYQDFEINEKEIYIRGTDLVLTYLVEGDRMRLKDRRGVEILLERSETS
ncbi:vWA domain-containing protein [Parerythrobacter aestuarii]|uniref:vWA domain-containing protein n=1 Tax=Parerythrobacter aestuarii TaxID=3020909 RepID=UPI0024DEDD5B|nr:VWA domain-containing protein [Parerythrobacter aestuarii]